MKKVIAAGIVWWSLPAVLLLLMHSSPLGADSPRSVARSTVSITKVPALSVVQLSNDELVFNADNSSDQSLVRLESGGQSLPYRLSASYRKAQGGEENSITQRRSAKPYSVFWSNPQRPDISLRPLVSSATVMQTNTLVENHDSVLSVRRNADAALTPASGTLADTLILTFIIE